MITFANSRSFVSDVVRDSSTPKAKEDMKQDAKRPKPCMNNKKRKK